MDWELCGRDLKCPAESYLKNGLEIYNNFLESVKEFEEAQSLPVPVHFKDKDTAETFMNHRAKWHKSCHLKFAPSKLIRLKEQLGKKRRLEVSDGDVQRKSKRMSMGTPSQASCIFCSKSNGRLHVCATMSLDHDLRQMATELQDTELLARISGGDLVAIEAKYHYDCLSTYKSKYRSVQRAKTDANCSNEVNIIRAQAFVELVSYIESSVETGNFIFKLAELYRLYQERLNVLGVETTTNKTRLKLRLLDHFSDKCQEQSDGKNVLIVFNEGMKKLLKEAVDFRDYESEALVIAQSVKFLRREILSWNPSSFTGHFPPDCQQSSLPTALKLFVSMLLNGQSVESRQGELEQASLTIAQLIYFKTKRKCSSSMGPRAWQSREREPPFPLYLGLKVHTLTRSKDLVNCLYRLGLTVSYDRVVELKASLATAVCKQFEEQKLVCPANLRKGLFTVGALDNIDHNPSATTAQGSFHGTGISIFQFPTASNTGVAKEPLVIEPGALCKYSLPDNYSTVPAISCKTNNLIVSEYIPPHENLSVLDGGKSDEENWIRHSLQLLTQKEKLTIEQSISWAAFHASSASVPVNPPVINSLLPLFYEKAATLSMIKHGMDIQQQITSYLNPGQIPVTTFDQPLFALAKTVQWRWPESHGERKHVVMFGGLHIEMALWSTIGDFLDSSGWTTALCEAGIATSGTADSFLHASHLMRTRYSHQVTLLALSNLQHEAWQKVSQEGESFEAWKQRMTSKSPTFKYWEIVRQFEILVCVFIRAHRIKNFNLFVESLEALAPWFFALDHINYARWIPVHIRDMKSLPDSIKEQFQSCWVVQKTQNKFSSMPIDQAHEQNNQLVKCSGGAVGLTENPSAFRRWMIAGPEQARLLTEFECQFMESKNHGNQHHEQTPSLQESFKRQVNSLSEVIASMGNPFLDNYPELLVLDTRNCVSDAVIATVQDIEKLGAEQYKQYVKDVLKNRSVSIQEPIKKNSLALFKRPLPNKSTKKKDAIASLKGDCHLFSHLFIASKFRDGNLEDFFAHENQPWPPSLSEHGKLRLPASKSDLLRHIEESANIEPPSSFHAKVFDGPAIVYTLPTDVKTFDDYCNQVFLPWTESALQNSDRVDIVWDIYKADSLKQSTREKRGQGVRRKVSGKAKVPSNFKDFLRDSRNKQELFEFLTQKATDKNYPSSKELYITSGIVHTSLCYYALMIIFIFIGSSVLCKGTCVPMSSCDHEEADTRMCIHIKDCLEKGARVIFVRTVDTDVIVIIAGLFFQLQLTYPGVEIWVAFGMGKFFRYIHLNKICQNLGEPKCQALPFYHAFTGCDTTSQFFGKGKKSSWEAWKSYPSATGAFQSVMEYPFQKLQLTSPTFEKLERFTCVLYDKTTAIAQVNELRQELFSKKAKLMDNIPPTQVC